VNLKCRVFGGKTGPMATVRVVGVVRPIATVRFQVELYPEPTREFGPVAHTNWKVTYQISLMPQLVAFEFSCESIEMAID
jgi:hypothetical protein